LTSVVVVEGLQIYYCELHQHLHTDIFLRIGDREEHITNDTFDTVEQALKGALDIITEAKKAYH